MINQLLLDHAPNAGGLWHTLVTFRNGYAMTAVICGAVCTLGLVWTVFTVKEDPTLRTHHTIGHLRALWQTMKNRSFLILMLAFLLMSALNSMGFASFPYLIQYWYYSGDRAAMARNLPMLMLPMLLIALPGFAFWTRVSRRTGKRTACLYGFGALSVVTIINFYMFTPHIPWLYWPWAVLFGFVCALTNMIVPAMIPDIVDEDELETGARREGSFFGANTFALKLAGALGVWLAGLSLDAIGFQKGAATQPEMTVFWLRAFYAFVRGGGLVVTFLVMFAFPLTPERVAGIRSQLNARKARSSQEAGTLTA
jgi:GPH family glycoside/pentoside/hexuronide:cation symporter